MAKKRRKRRFVEEPGRRGVSSSADARPAGEAESGTTGPPQDAEGGLSWKVQVGIFLAMLLLTSILLFGVYVPYMRGLSERAIERGDSFAARAEALEADSAAAFPVYDQIEESINRLLIYDHAVRAYFPAPAAERGEGSEIYERMTAARDMAYPEIGEVADFAGGALVAAGLDSEFPEILTELDRRRERCVSGLEYLMEFGPDDIDKANEYGTVQKEIDNFLIVVRRIRDLFDREASLDQALREYMDAVGYSRLWPEPREHLARLYAERGWFEFAEMEYLRIMKLDPDGEYGERAFEALSDFASRTPPPNEAHYYLGIAYLLKGDRDAAAESLRTYMGVRSTSVFTAKTDELLGWIEEGNDEMISSFLEDEIWI